MFSLKIYQRHSFFYIIFLFCISSLYSFDETFDNFGELEAEESILLTDLMEIKTPFGQLKIEIHFKRVRLPLIEGMKENIRTHVLKVVDYFQYVPRQTLHIMLVDAISANGSARVFPYNQIVLHDFPFVGRHSLSVDNSWNLNLIVHEFAHILHLEQTGSVGSLLQYILGNTVHLLSSIAPTWFKEGIAVWVETEFTREGRNRDALLKRELESIFENPKFCADISCLDNPGLYLFFNLPYAVGGQFMDFLEKEKEGTLRCLVTEHSRVLPFFLDRAFETCTGTNAATAFLRYRKTFSSKRGKDSLASQFEVYKFDRQLSKGWRSDFYIMQDSLYVKKFNGEEVTLGFYNLRTKEKLSQRFKDQLLYLFPPTSYDRSQLEIPFSFKLNKKPKHQNYSLKTKEFSSVLGKDDEGEIDYRFRIGEDHYWILNYFAGRWFLYSKRKERTHLIWKSEVGFNITSPVWIVNEGLLFTLGESFKYSLAFIPYVKDEEEGKLSRLYSSTQPFGYLESCGSYHFLQKQTGTGAAMDETGDRALIVDTNFKEKTSVVYGVNDKFPKDLLALRWNEKWTVVLGKTYSDRFYYMERGCGYFVDLWRDRRVLSHEIIEENPVEKFSSNPTVYRSYRHLKPHHLKLSFRNEDEKTEFNMQTSLEDPLKIHRIILSGTYVVDKEDFYLKYKKVVLPRFSYAYRYKKHVFGIEYEQYLENFEERHKGTMIGLFYQKQFVFDRSSLSLRGLFTKYSYVYGDSYKQVLDVEWNIKNTISKNLTLRKESTYLGDLNFLKINLSAVSSWNLTYDLKLHLMRRHSRWHLLFQKDTFYENFLNYLRENDEENYWLIELDHTLSRIYRGHHLFPLYLKDIHIVLGSQYMENMDDGTTFIYGSAALNLTVAYHLPVTISYSYYVNASKNRENDPQGVLLIDANF